MAAVMVMVIVVGAGIVVARVVSRPSAVIDEGVPPTASEAGDGPSVSIDEELTNRADVTMLLNAPPDPGAVPGSYLAVVDASEQGSDIVEVVGDTVWLQYAEPWENGVPASWRGFGTSDRLYLVEDLVTGDELFAKLRVGPAGAPAWYRRPTAPVARYGRDIAATPIPTYTDGTRGFERVDDPTATASELTRWSADVATADLGFLGPFAPTYRNNDYAQGEARIDIHIDDVRRVRTVTVDPEKGSPTTTRFGRFDGLAPITVPPGDVPVAKDVSGMSVEGCGHEDAEDGLRDRLATILNEEPNIAASEFVPMPTPEHDKIDGGPPPREDRLFVVAVRFRDTADAEVTYDRVSDRLGDVTVDVTDGDEFAYTCSVGTVGWIELAGQQ